jgi:2-polyprenyl-3-methyl-5-hydroxy-6-metoxy-1,4-benzoquinol methylase
MDDPAIDRNEHHQALNGLARVNSFSRSAQLLWPAIFAVARTVSHGPTRVLDVATGAGDVPVKLCQLAQRDGVSLEMAACDVSPVALECARARAEAAGLRLHLFQRDAVNEATEDEYDVVMSSLFLHHLPSVQAITLLCNMRESSSKLVLVNDLRRCTAGLAAAWIGTRLLTRSRVVHVDGVRSVRAAFTIPEVRTLAQQAGMRGVSIERRWPWRFLMQWTRM